MNPSSRHSLSILVRILVPLGLFSTIGAIVLTLYALSNGLGQESNPYFYDLGPTLFIIAGGIYILIFYIVAWFSPAKLELKFIAVLPATLFHFLDFAHDFTGVLRVTISSSIPILLFNDPTSAMEFLLAGAFVGFYSFVMLIILAIAWRSKSLQENKIQEI